MRWPWSKQSPSPEPAPAPPPVAGPDPIRIDLPEDPPLADPVDVPPVDPGEGWERRQPTASLAPVWVRGVSDDVDGWQQWQQRVAEHPTTGLWPVLVDPNFWEAVDDDAVASLREDEPARDGRAELFERLQHGDLLARLPRGERLAPEDPKEGEDADVDEFDVLQVLQDGVISDGGDLVLVPAGAGWQVPEILGWDGPANGGPVLDELSAILRRWHGHWQADLLGLTRDEVILLVRRPPTTPDDTFRVAVEVAAAAPDTVTRFDSIEQVAAWEVTRSAWTLWWD